jgi:hypothetical protein
MLFAWYRDGTYKRTMVLVQFILLAEIETEYYACVWWRIPGFESGWSLTSINMTIPQDYPPFSYEG